MLGRMAKSIKDGALAVGIKAYVNDRLDEYGEVLDCQIDTTHSKLTFRALLRGERDPVDAAVDRYEIVRDGDEVFIIIRSFSTSREWITTLVNKLLIGKRFKIPSKVAALL